MRISCLKTTLGNSSRLSGVNETKLRLLKFQSTIQNQTYNSVNDIKVYLSNTYDDLKAEQNKTNLT